MHIFHFPSVQSPFSCSLVSNILMVFAMGTQELRLEINPWELLHERNKLFPSFIQEPANENWICSPLNSFTGINSPHFAASMKHGQIENFPVAPSSTACLENPPVFLTKNLILAFPWGLPAVSLCLTCSRGHLMKHQSRHWHHLTPSAVSENFSCKVLPRLKCPFWGCFPPLPAERIWGDWHPSWFAFIFVTLRGEKFFKIILFFLIKPQKFGNLWSNIQKAP